MIELVIRLMSTLPLLQSMYVSQYVSDIVRLRILVTVELLIVRILRPRICMRQKLTQMLHLRWPAVPDTRPECHSDVTQQSRLIQTS